VGLGSCKCNASDSPTSNLEEGGRNTRSELRAERIGRAAKCLPPWFKSSENRKGRRRWAYQFHLGRPARDRRTPPQGRLFQGTKLPSDDARGTVRQKERRRTEKKREEDADYRDHFLYIVKKRRLRKKTRGDQNEKQGKLLGGHHTKKGVGCFETATEWQKGSENPGLTRSKKT